MFRTELEAIENGFLLKVTYNLYFKKWSYRYLEELVCHRSRLEGYYIDRDTETLKEEML